MAPIVTVIVEGVQTVLSDGSLCSVVNFTEVGMPPVTRITEQGPLQHGDTDIDFRLQARVFSMLLIVTGTSWTDLENKRRTIQGIFKPRRKPIQLVWTFDAGNQRQIDCYFYQQMPMSTTDQEGFTLLVPIVLRAPNPLFYNPQVTVFEFGLSGSSGGLGAIPLVVPMAVGASVLNQTIAIPYAGDFEANPTVIIQGPIIGPIIANAVTGEVLDFTGSSIAAGAAITVDTRYGYKTVIDNLGVNQIAELTDASDLATFHLAADPDAAGGINPITVSGTGVSAATEVYLIYNSRFLGL